MLNIDYILINLLVLYVFCECGSLISKGRSYWNNACICIFFYSIMLGVRFARGTDYHGYSALFASQRIHETNPLFSFVNIGLSFVGFNRYSCFLVYAFVFVLCAMVFMKQYRTYAKYMFPCFLIGYLTFEENMIRQAFSYSFIFLFCKELFQNSCCSLKELYKDKITLRRLVGLALLVYALHSANFIILSLLVLFYYVYNKPIKPKVSIPLFVMCVYILPRFVNFSFLQSFVSVLAEHNEMVNAYNQHSDAWFSSSAQSDIFKKNFFSELLQVFGCSACMFLLYKRIVSDSIHSRMLTTILNMFVVGLCVESLFLKLEILNRIGITTHVIGYFALPFILMDAKLKKAYQLYYVFLIWFLYGYVRYVFDRPWAMFIWDTPYSFF